MMAPGAGVHLKREPGSPSIKRGSRIETPLLKWKFDEAYSDYKSAEEDRSVVSARKLAAGLWRLRLPEFDMNVGRRVDLQDWEIKALGEIWAIPCSKEAKVFREHLVEFNNQIYLVFLLSRDSADVVDDFEVLRLDVVDGYSWEKVESLPADAMFFVEERCCIGISARAVGSRGNYDYFTHDRAAGWGEMHFADTWTRG